METDIPIYLQTEHVSKQVQSGESQLTILKDINLIIKKGESVAILGASGSGKTTLLTLLSGLDMPTKGQVFFQNKPLHTLNDEERASLRGKQMGFIFQSFQLLPALTALENVMLPLELQYIRHREAEQRAADWLEQVGLKNRIHHFPSQLSGGEQQRVAIARAFITQPSVIFADEMTGNLDESTGNVVMDILFNLNRDLQTTLVIVTHDSILANRCQRRLMLADGALKPC